MKGKLKLNLNSGKLPRVVFGKCILRNKKLNFNDINCNLINETIVRNDNLFCFTYFEYFLIAAPLRRKQNL